ncbi:FAD-dependent oxidoreductase [Streptomyces sp. ICBB 8177]|uniref:FAD-dependent oxidoreductase n=1 Tax=Streptomyces sp. ICBB 8177 TaxID=563922 RepID=UPI000D6838A7|nr:FAD-dependent oxidoreductase [Streptomyces sp. ICBB 8177]PWI42526.1 monooxygenase [Streptomyces sp. ICBB 8177]
MSEENVEVLVVGGGVVGLSAAVFLRTQGVRVLLAERHPGPSMLARARVLSPRTMEVFRAHGLEEPVRAAPPSVFLTATDVVRAATLSSPEDYREQRPPSESVAPFSPCPPALVEQSVVEPLVRARAVELGADVRFDTEVGGVRQDADGVTATLTDRRDGTRRTVRAGYLIAADGHRSPVRRALGIGTRGERLAHVVNIAFEANLDGALRERPVGLAYLGRPVPGTLLARLDADHRWVLMVPYEPDRGESAASFTAERSVRAVREAVGDPGLPVRLLPAVPGGDHTVHTWELASWVADGYRRGRVLLAGDAAHVVPPSGGLGANTGVQDAHNLAWKLAAVLAGRADDALLDTYEAERRPVAEVTCALSTRLQQARNAPGGAGDVGERVALLALGQGFRYASDAVAADDDAATQACGAPGTRAPHVPLERDGVPCSSLDLYGHGFTLVLGPGADATRTGVAGGLDVVRLGVDATDPADGWAPAHGVGRDGAVLVRPDGFIGWRTRSWEPARARTLPDLLRRLHARGARPALVDAAD